MKLTKFEEIVEYVLGFFFVSEVQKIKTKGGEDGTFLMTQSQALEWADGLGQEGTTLHTWKRYADNQNASFFEREVLSRLADPLISLARLMAILLVKMQSGVTSLTLIVVITLVLSYTQYAQIVYEDSFAGQLASQVNALTRNVALSSGKFTPTGLNDLVGTVNREDTPQDVIIAAIESAATQVLKNTAGGFDQAAFGLLNSAEVGDLEAFSKLE